MARMIDLKITFTAYVSVPKAPTGQGMEEKMNDVMQALEDRSIEEIRESGLVFHAAKSEYEIEN